MQLGCGAAVQVTSPDPLEITVRSLIILAYVITETARIPGQRPRAIVRSYLRHKFLAGPLSSVFVVARVVNTWPRNGSLSWQTGHLKIICVYSVKFAGF